LQTHCTQTFAVHAIIFIQIRYGFHCCQRWLWPSWSLSTLEWKSTASIITMCLLYQQMLPAIKHVAGDTFVFQQDNAPSHRAKDAIRLLQQETPDIVGMISGHQTAQTWIHWIVRSGVLCGRECMNVVWTAPMSWSSSSLNLEQSAAERYWRGHQRVEKVWQAVFTFKTQL